MNSTNHNEFLGNAIITILDKGYIQSTGIKELKVNNLTKRSIVHTNELSDHEEIYSTFIQKCNFTDLIERYRYFPSMIELNDIVFVPYVGLGDIKGELSYIHYVDDSINDKILFVIKGDFENKSESTTTKLYKLLNILNSSQSCFENISSYDRYVLGNTCVNESIKGDRISVEQFYTIISTNKMFSCSKKDMLLHKHSKNVLKTFTITSNDKARWLKFGELIQNNKDRLVTFLNLASVPFKIEKVLHKDKTETYNVWVFLRPIQAKKARDFGNCIITLLSADSILTNENEQNKFTCTLSPRYTSHDRRTRDIIKLPLSKSSYIMIDGEYKNTFRYMESIEYFDLSLIDVNDFGKKVTEFTGRFNRLLYNRDYIKIVNLKTKADNKQKKIIKQILSGSVVSPYSSHLGI